MLLEDLRLKLIHRGHIETDEHGAVTSTARKHWSRSKSDLIAESKIAIEGLLVWKL